MEIINLHWDPNPYSRGLEEVVNLDNVPGEGFQLVGREVAVSKAETIDVAANKTKSTPHEVKKEAQAQAVDISKKESNPSNMDKASEEKKQGADKPETIDISKDAAKEAKSHAEVVKLHPTPSPTVPPHVAARNFDFWDSLVKPLEARAAGQPIQGAADVGVSAVLSSLGITVALFLVLVGIYELCFRLFPSVYNSKKSSKREAELQQPVIIPRTCLPLGWIPSVMRVPWSQVRKLGGLESYLYLRYIRMCLQISMVSAFWGLVLLFPIYATGGNHATGFYHVSASNLEQGSVRLWAPTAFMWLLVRF